jgi:hypothetical protein
VPPCDGVPLVAGKLDPDALDEGVKGNNCSAELLGGRGQREVNESRESVAEFRKVGVAVAARNRGGCDVTSGSAALGGLRSRCPTEFGFCL